LQKLHLLNNGSELPFHQSLYMAILYLQANKKDPPFKDYWM